MKPAYLPLKREIPPIVPVFEPLYNRLETANLHTFGLEGVMGILDLANKDKDFKTLARLTKRRVIQFINTFQNLNVDTEGYFYIWHHGHDPAGFDIAFKEEPFDEAILKLSPHDLNAVSVRNGILDYVRFAPYNDTRSTHFRKSEQAALVVAVKSERPMGILEALKEYFNG